MFKEVPAPGSPAAIKLGCECPVFDNSFGKGTDYIDDDGPLYYIVTTCPVHGTPNKKDRRRNVSDKAQW